MKPKNRKQRQQIYYHLYHRDYSYPANICAYCTSPSDSIDHVPPLSITENIDVEEFKERGGEFLLVPSCRMCNNLLGNRSLPTMLDRTNWLYNKYISLADKHFRNWDEDELEELGPGLQKYIKAHDFVARDYIRRAQGTEVVLLGLEPI